MANSVLNLLPYPAQLAIIKALESCPDDILNLLSAFPNASLETTANETKGHWIFPKIFPLLLPYIKLEHVLICRQICSGWKRVVDVFLENVGLVDPTYSKSVDYLDAIHDWRQHPFPEGHNLRVWGSESPQFLSFLQEMALHPGNPFPFRALTLFINAPWNAEDLANATEFLERFGQHLWKLRLDCKIPDTQALPILCHVLRCTPQVRTLSLGFRDDDAPAPQELENPVAFPPLPHLTNFLVDWHLSPTFQRFILPQYSSQLMQLKGTDVHINNVMDLRTLGTLPNLQLLEVNVVTEQDLRSLTRLNCPLRKLRIRSIERIPLSVYLEVAHHFHETLECLRLVYRDDWFEGLVYFNQEHRPQEEAGETWEFPKLVTLYLEYPNPVESFDALKRMKPGPKTLEIKTYAEWEPEYKEDHKPFFEEMEGEMVEVHGYLNRMYESAIWEEMPQLERIKVDAYGPEDHSYCIYKVYTRGGK